MTDKNGSQPAYPVMGVETDLEPGWADGPYARTYSYEKDAGLTKREYFAAMAMQGLLAQITTVQEPRELLTRTAKVSVSFADALLEALAQSGVSK